MIVKSIWHTIGRMMWCAVAGAVYIGLASLVIGLIGGIFAATLSYYESPYSVSLSGWLWFVTFWNAVIVAAIGLATAFFAFAIVGFLFCFSDYSDNMLGGVLESSLLPVSIGFFAGGFLGIINSLLWRHTTIASWSLFHAFTTQTSRGFSYGALIGLFIGTFYGAIVGARREIARQKSERNAPFSTVESGA